MRREKASVDALIKVQRNGQYCTQCGAALLEGRYKDFVVTACSQCSSHWEATKIILQKMDQKGIIPLAGDCPKNYLCSCSGGVMDIPMGILLVHFRRWGQTFNGYPCPFCGARWYVKRKG